MSFNYSGNYVCECGREFTNSQSFNGHKSHCKVHLNDEHKIEMRHSINRKAIQNSNKSRSIRAQNKREEELFKWISEQHKCEICGKVMTEKYGSGRFCCQSCANTRKHSDDTKQKLSKAATGKPSSIKRKRKLEYEASPKLCSACGEPIEYEHKRRKFCNKCEESYRSIKNNSVDTYNKNPKLCAYCSNPISYEFRKNKYCSSECRYAALSKIQKSNFENGGLNHLTVKSRYKYGTYKGYSCDSSYELAFVIYNLDHNIEFSRNTSVSFEYIFNGVTHRFFPDFLVNDEYIELKSWHSQASECKANSVPDNIKFRILYTEDIKPYLDYALETYGPNWTKLYDRNYPSWLDNIDNED